jgi:hypothetical protein
MDQVAEVVQVLLEATDQVLLEEQEVLEQQIQFQDQV